jgi:hypothetical protein
VTITASLQSDSSKTATATVRFGDALPGGFLAVFDDGGSSEKIWSDAGTFCAQQGGRLPRIKGATGLSAGQVSYGDSVDGFGTIEGTWPSGLLNVLYWTGTEVTGYSGYSWVVFYTQGLVNWSTTLQTSDWPVVCVP